MGAAPPPIPSFSVTIPPGLDSSAAVLAHLATLQDETRVRLLMVLSGGEYTVGELCQVLALPQSTVSRHLKTLAEGGWVAARSEGTSRLYRFPQPRREPERGLWAVVRKSVEGSPLVRDDARRAHAVLSQRQERSRSFFRSAAGRWDTLRAELFGPRSEERALLGLLDPEWTVADLGCGTGVLSALLAPSVGRVLAVDREPEMLEAAAARLEDFRNVELRPGELEALPIGDGELDAAFCVLVLHLVPDPYAVLQEAARSLRTGGILVLVDMREHPREEYRAEMGHLWTGFPTERMEGWLEDAGFAAVRIRPLPPLPPARGPLLFTARGRKG